MNLTEAVKEFADRLSDELSPAMGGEPGGSLARLIDSVARAGVDDRELLVLMAELTRLLNLTTTALAGVSEAAARSGLPTRKRVRSVVDLLKGLGHSPAAAHRLARVGGVAATLPSLSRQARAGGVSVEHVDAVGRGIAFVEKRIPLDSAAREDLARRLTVQETPADVARRARELALEWAPELDESDPDSVPVAENSELNEMSLAVGADGRISATLDVDVLTGEELSAALDRLCRPVPLPDGSPDPRAVGRRRADAFGQIVRSFLSGRDRPSSGGVLPHVTLVVPSRTEERVSGRRSEAEQRVSSLGYTGPVSSATVGLVLCDAAVRRIVVDGESVPLDVGREQRLVTAGIRRALEVRDRGCAFPGCGRPVGWTDAHHCIPWSQGGETSLDNSVLLCRMHHTLIHQSGWEVFIGHDRYPWFREPADTDQPHRPRRELRSNARRTLTSAPAAA
ncbi:DUF222 domain-containing protein [Gordonia sp. PS3]|uniref:HNH nuclease domain-containing protein n=1 Tax=Gordonia sihwensis NBRC 108236 TaxID=1223544 RepID=L7LIM0_9ACTN|nr:MULTISPECIES: HNH endonuclease signature motif containing protein [Gordonia]AUH67902.1 HNH endonuclease [Gordonia sp. YC-JH1]KXT58142.1 HNH endonuclease [Gordonia sp. QH-12]GAC60729.1 hypothetical protein GSI01S_11_00720 [Gordonia sihwensis NBRC 108236]